jgi:hypothetical protein
MNTTTQAAKLFDVVAVDMETMKVRLLATDKTEANAEAIVNIAVMRNGVDKEFFTTVPLGKYKTGDEYQQAQS